jgi:hypothetical protein
MEEKDIYESDLPGGLVPETYEEIIERHAKESINYTETSFKPYLEFPQVSRKRIAEFKKDNLK